MKCPICTTRVDLADPFMPVCSQRCKDTDLGNWATEKYIIPAPLTPDEIEELFKEQKPN